MEEKIPAIFQKIYTVMDRNKDGNISKKDDLSSMTADEQQEYINLTKELPVVIANKLQGSVWVNEKNEIQSYTKKTYDKKITELLDEYGGEELFKAYDINNDGKTNMDELVQIFAEHAKNGSTNFKTKEFETAQNLLTETQKEKLNKLFTNRIEAGEEMTKENFFTILKEVKKEEEK